MEYCFTIDQIDEAAHWLMGQLQQQNVLAFYGEMGAGKTSFIRAVCRVLEVQDKVSSPTFSIINEYRYTKDGRTDSVFHLDLYRLKDEAEAIGAGVEDALLSGHLCLVEWPEKAPVLFPDDTLYLSLTVLADQKRKLEILKK